ncbi:gag-pol polyprotein [Tanacetum coccineum]
MKDPGLFTLPCRLGDSKPFDTLADLGSCVNLIPLYLFKKLKIGLLEETDHVFGLADGTKSYPVGIIKNVEVHIERLKLLDDFYIIDMEKDHATPLLLGRGFLATANVLIDCKKAKIVVGEGVTRSIFGVKEISLGNEEIPYWTTLEKQLDKEEFQEIGSMAAGRVLETQFQKFIKSRLSLVDDDDLMTRKYFLAYTQTEVQQFRDTLIQHIESVKKSIDERAQHKREHDTRTESEKQDTSSSSGNDADADDIDIKPVYDEEPMVEVQLTTDNNVFATGQQYTEQPEFNNEGEVDQNVKQCHDTRPLPAQLTDNQITELSNQSLEFENIYLKKIVAQFQKDFSGMEAHLTTPYLHKEKEYAFAKPHYVIASSESRNSSKNMPRFSSNDMVHNHYLEEAKKKTQERDITNLPECIQIVDSSTGTSINIQVEQNLDLSADTPFNLKKERIKACIKDNVISGRPSQDELIAPDSPSTTTVTEDAPAATNITSPSQTSPPDTGVDGPENNY